MLRIENLSIFYAAIPALKGVSIEVPKGEIVSIIGANGAGKSTLLKAITGLIKTQRGSILYKDRDIVGLPVNKIVGLGISQVPEGRQIFAHLKVQDNIHLGAYLYHRRRNRAEIDRRIEKSAGRIADATVVQQPCDGRVRAADSAAFVTGQALKTAEPEQVLDRAVEAQRGLEIEPDADGRLAARTQRLHGHVDEIVAIVTAHLPQ